MLDSIHNGSSYQQVGIKDLKKEEIDPSFSTKEKFLQPNRPMVSSKAEMPEPIITTENISDFASLGERTGNVNEKLSGKDLGCNQCE